MKNRKKQIFNYIPKYEQIQLLVYTKLCKCNNIIFTQCINDEIKEEILENYEDEKLWNEIIRKLKKYVNIIYKLQQDNIFRKEFLLNNNRYLFLQKYLEWL